MAITTDSRLGIVISGVRVSEIGLSKSLNNYTIDEIFQSAYCGEYDVLRENNHVSVEDTSFSEGNPDFNYPLTYVSGNWADGGDVANYTDPDGLYGKVIWLYNTGTFDNFLTTASLSNYKLVTEWEVNKFLTVIPQTFNRGPCNASLCPSSWDQDKSFPAIYYTPGLVISTEYHTHYGNPDDSAVAVDIKPYIITKFNGIPFIYAFNMLDTLHYFYACEGPKVFAQGGISSPSGEVSLASVISVDYFSATETGNFTYSYYPGDNGIPFRYPLGNYGEIIRAMVSKDKKYLSSWKTGGTVEAMFAGLVICKYLTKRQDALMFYANCGIRFYAGTKLYKPIIEEGIVTGFTDDLSAPSDIDNWNGSSIHDIPDTPGGGGGGGSTGDDMEAMATGATGSSGGFTHFYIMSPQDLIDFLADFYTRASSGETLTNNLVCSYILGIPSSEFCATEEVPIAIHNSAQGTPFVSQANYSHIIATNNLLVVGSFDVPRMTNTFYDFAPYSTYEVFIPCCGWVALPDTVAGRRINVEMYIDVASCCLKAAVKTNDLGVCAVTNGVLGASIPIAVIESGILRGNNIQAGLGIIGGGINTGVGAGSGNAMGIGFGVQQILNGLVECTIAGNTNYTQQKGGTGDITQFAMGHKCYMKISHPDIDPVVIESTFGHSVGYLCNSIGKLSTYSGFTVCGNPHVTFSASAEEREEIERLLSMGVIL